MDEPIDRALARAADGPADGVDLDEVAAIARRRRRRQRLMAGAGVVLVLLAVPVAAVLAWGEPGEDGVVLAPAGERDADPPTGGDPDGADTPEGRAEADLEVREEESWGPLAVEPPQDLTTAAKAGGVRVRITDECVWQVEEGEDHRTLLVWPADRTTWNDDTGTISFEGSDGTITVTDGDRVNMGGGARTLDSFDELVASLDWVSPPAQECRTDVYWSVSDVWKGPAS